VRRSRPTFVIAVVMAAICAASVVGYVQLKKKPAAGAPPPASESAPPPTPTALTRVEASGIAVDVLPLAKSSVAPVVHSAPIVHPVHEAGAKTHADAGINPYDERF